MPNRARAEVLGRGQVQAEWMPETGVPVWCQTASVVRKAKFSKYRPPKTLSGDTGDLSASGSNEEGY